MEPRKGGRAGRQGAVLYSEPREPLLRFGVTFLIAWAAGRWPSALLKKSPAQRAARRKRTRGEPLAEHERDLIANGEATLIALGFLISAAFVGLEAFVTFVLGALIPLLRLLPEQRFLREALEASHLSPHTTWNVGTYGRFTRRSSRVSPAPPGSPASAAPLVRLVPEDGGEVAHVDRAAAVGARHEVRGVGVERVGLHVGCGMAFLHDRGRPDGYGALRTARTGPRLLFKPRLAPFPSAAAFPLKKTRQADPSSFSLEVQ